MLVRRGISKKANTLERGHMICGLLRAVESILTREWSGTLYAFILRLLIWMVQHTLD